MIYAAKLRVKVPGDRAATDKRRDKVLKLVEKHDLGQMEGPIAATRNYTLK